MHIKPWQCKVSEVFCTITNSLYMCIHETSWEHFDLKSNKPIYGKIIENKEDFTKLLEMENCFLC